MMGTNFLSHVTALGARLLNYNRGSSSGRRPCPPYRPVWHHTLRHRRMVGRASSSRKASLILLSAAACCALCYCGGLAEAQHYYQDGATSFNCCSGEEAQLDCSNSGVEHLGQSYYCMSLESAEMRACISCLPPTTSGVKCSSCCGTPNAECDLEWSWGAVLATLSVSAVFATCSGILALAEKRRKRKGMSLARAWSIPHGMPVLRATVVDLSDAVRGRASIWSVDGLNHEGVSEEDLLEHVGLLEEIPNDSIYGALVEQRDADIPVAKLAEDNWVTAMAWRQASTTTANSITSNPNNPVTYGSHDEISAVEDAPSVSRWRSARATARQARRINRSSSSSSGGSGGGGGGGATVAASTAYRNPPPPPLSLVNDNRNGAAGAGVGDGGSGWDRNAAIVIVGDGSESSEQEAPR